jgi:hypothetical protein
MASNDETEHDYELMVLDIFRTEMKRMIIDKETGLENLKISPCVGSIYRKKYGHVLNALEEDVLLIAADKKKFTEIYATPVLKSLLNVLKKCPKFVDSVYVDFSYWKCESIRTNTPLSILYAEFSLEMSFWKPIL